MPEALSIVAPIPSETDKTIARVDPRTLLAPLMAHIQAMLWQALSLMILIPKGKQIPIGRATESTIKTLMSPLRNRLLPANCRKIFGINIMRIKRTMDTKSGNRRGCDDFWRADIESEI